MSRVVDSASALRRLRSSRCVARRSKVSKVANDEAVVTVAVDAR